MTYPPYSSGTPVTPQGAHWQGGQQPYGAPYPGPRHPQQQAPPRPATVTYAVTLMWVQVALMLVGLIPLFMAAEKVTTVPDPSQGFVSGAMMSVIVFGVFLVLLIAGLYAALTVQVRNGREWARIVTWVLSGIFILLFLAQLGEQQPWWNWLLGTVSLLVDVGIVTLLALRPSNDFFARRQRF